MIRQYIGARYTTKIYENTNDLSSAEWENGVEYEPLTLVTYNNSSYISRKIVPANIGNPVDNPTYWVCTGYFNGQILNLQNQIDKILNEYGIFYTPEMFGAKGDGLTDDTSAIQNAVNSGCCILAEKKYLITDTIKVKTNTGCLRGLSSKSQLIVNFNSEKPAVLFYGDSTGGQLTRKDSSSVHGHFSIVGAPNSYIADGIMIGGDEDTEYEGDISTQIFEHIMIDWVEKAVIVNRKCYNNLFIGINANICHYGLYVKDDYGTGEVNTFLNCSFWNGAHYIQSIWASFIGCTFHILQGAYQSMGGHNCDIYLARPCRFTDCHFERLTWSDDTVNNFGDGIYVDTEAFFTNCEFNLDTRAHKCNSVIKVGDQSSGNFTVKRAVLDSCSIQFAVRNNTIFEDAVFYGNIVFAHNAAKANSSSSEILIDQPYSNKMIKLTPSTSSFYHLTEHVTTNAVDNGDGSYTIEATPSEYVGALNYHINWELPVECKSAVLLQIKTAVSAGQTYFGLNPSLTLSDQSIVFYDAAGNEIDFTHINDVITKSVNSNTLDGLVSRFFEIPAECVKIRVGWWFNGSATGAGVTKTMTFNAKAFLI